MWFSRPKPEKRATMPAAAAAYYTHSPSSSHTSSSSPSHSHPHPHPPAQSYHSHSRSHSTSHSSPLNNSSSSTRPSFIVPLPPDLGTFSASQLRSLTAGIELRFGAVFDVFGTLDCVLKDVRWLSENVGDLKGAFYMSLVVLNALPRTREVIAFMRAPGTTQSHRIRFQNYLVDFQVIVDHLEAQIMSRDRHPTRKFTR